MTNEAHQLLAELTNYNHVARATSFDEARANPGRVAEVDEETYWYYLEVLPPQFMWGPVFAFAEGAEAYLLFWRSGATYHARQLTWDETASLARALRIPPPGSW